MPFVIIALTITGIIVATLKFKIHPVLSLVLAALFAGFGLGLPAKNILEAISQGFGSTLSNIGLVIAFGSIIGVYLEKTGATQVLAAGILKAVGLKNAPLALNLAGFVIAIPVYCDSGFVILASLQQKLAKKTGIAAIVFAIALATGLYAAHVFVPPTPGPLAAAAIVGAKLGWVLLLGIVVAIPTTLVGWLYAKIVGVKFTSNKVDIPRPAPTTSLTPKITFGQALLPLMVPIICIALKSVASYPTYPLGQGLVLQICNVIGHPVIALLIGVFLAILTAWPWPTETRNNWLVNGLQQAGLILLITGSGGAFGQVIRQFDFANALNLSSGTGLVGLLVCFGIAAVIKTAQGSSTVAIITTAAMLAPLLTVFGLQSTTQVALVVLAIGAGAMTVSHVNDSYFWVVTQFSKISVKTALQTFTVATFLQGVVALLWILILYALL